MKLTNIYKEILNESSEPNMVSVNHLINLLKNNMITNPAAKPHMKKWIKRGVPGGMVELSPREFQLWKDIKLGGPKPSMYGPKNEQLLNESTDCSNLFTDSADGTYHKHATGNDLYFYVVKEVKVKRELISPQKFFGPHGNSGRFISPAYDLVDIDKKVEQMKSGVKLDMPYLTFNRHGKNTGHEGRHRSAAAIKIGCTAIPVMVEREVFESDIMALANMVGHLEDNEMIVELKKMGFQHFQNIEQVGTVLRMSKKNGKYYRR